MYDIPLAVEGPAGPVPDLDAVLDDDGVRLRALEARRRTGREPALLDISSHLLVAGRRP